MTTKPVQRMVVFMTGYDPAGPERYHLMLRQQSRYYSKRFSVPLKLGDFERNKQPDSFFSKIQLNAQWADGECHIDYYISDWQDIVLEMEALPFWKRSWLYLDGYFSSWISGAFPKISKWQKKFQIIFSVPLFCLLFRILIFLFSIFVCAKGMELLGLSMWLSASVGGAIGAYCVYKLQPFFTSLYETQIAGPVIFQTFLSKKGDKNLKVRSTIFSNEILQAVKEKKPDEVIIISHSCGCFHALPLHKALLEQRASSSNKPAIIQFSIGSLFPFTLAYPPEKFYRGLARDLLLNNECRWVDFFAPHDPFSVPFADAKNDFNLLGDKKASAKHEVRSAKFREIFDEKKMRVFKYNPLRMHFQYLAANDVTGDYDFFRMITHPYSVQNNLSNLKGLEVTE